MERKEARVKVVFKELSIAENLQRVRRGIYTKLKREIEQVSEGGAWNFDGMCLPSS